MAASHFHRTPACNYARCRAGRDASANVHDLWATRFRASYGLPVSTSHPHFGRLIALRPGSLHQATAGLRHQRTGRAAPTTPHLYISFNANVQRQRMTTSIDGWLCNPTHQCSLAQRISGKLKAPVKAPSRFAICDEILLKLVAEHDAA